MAPVIDRAVHGKPTGMRTPQQMAENLLVGSDEHKRRATLLKRLAGGLRAQTVGELGLDERERKILAQAAGLVDRMALASAGAAVLSKKRRDKLERRAQSITKAMQPTFGSLKAVGDQVAVIAAVSDYVLEEPHRFKDPRRLQEAFDEALGSLADSRSRTADTRKVDQVVAQAWQKFKDAKTDLQAQYRDLIEALSIQASASQAGRGGRPA
ncbi:MAG: hypothetical protein JF606_19605 [Burkholderiales bacterium]|nr:hypothetical protein [Burkholderiales bacterium]